MQNYAPFRVLNWTETNGYLTAEVTAERADHWAWGRVELVAFRFDGEEWGVLLADEETSRWEPWEDVAYYEGDEDAVLNDPRVAAFAAAAAPQP